MELDIDRRGLHPDDVVTVTPQVAGTWNNGQVALPAGAATQVRPAVVNRLSISIVNDGANPIWLGKDNTVTNLTGHLLTRFGVAKITAWQGTIYAYAAAGAASNCGYIELVV